MSPTALLAQGGAGNNNKKKKNPDDPLLFFFTPFSMSQTFTSNKPFVVSMHNLSN